MNFFKRKSYSSVSVLNRLASAFEDSFKNNLDVFPV